MARVAKEPDQNTSGTRFTGISAILFASVRNLVMERLNLVPDLPLSCRVRS